jgi:protein-arginine kinase activator protein McsA
LAGYAYDSGACYQCHPAGTASGSIAGHAFPIDAQAVHTGLACATCHIDPASRAVFSCITGCHEATTTNANHAGVTGYSYDSQQCLSCHPKGIAEGSVSHAAFYPIGVGTKHALGCVQCHTDPTDKATLSKLACATCHLNNGTAQQHAAVADFAGTGSIDSARCLLCHGDGQLDTVAAHTQFSIRPASPTHDTLCVHCHNTMRTDKTYAADFRATDCLTCHAGYPDVSAATLQATHATVAGYQATSAACLACHPTGVGIAPANHGQYFPVDAGSAHASVGCRECHTNLAAPQNAANFACGSCHQTLDATILARHTTTTSAPAIVVKANEIDLTDSRTCLRCHADSQVDLTASHSRTSPCSDAGSPPHQGAGCTSCHSSYRSDKPFGANFTANPPAGCAQCHENNQTCP